MKRANRATLSIASTLARDLTGAGAEAVVLTGSQARGDAHPASDLDLYAIGDGPAYRLERRGGLLVSVSWRTRDQIEAAFLDPAQVGAFIPGWRQAIILEDPKGVAAGTIDRARAWSWDAIGHETIDRHVAEGVTGYAEEVHKLVAMLGRGRLQSAAIQRSVIALRIPILMSIHLRLLYDTENALWDLVAKEMGEEWGQVQAAALGVTDRPFEDTCVSALTLFQYACAAVEPFLEARQREVIHPALNACATFTPLRRSGSVVVILIERDGRFLFVREQRQGSKPEWYFPSGAVEAGESLLDTARREALEETGWPVEPTHLLHIDHGYFARPPGVGWWRHIVVAHPVPGAEPTDPENAILDVEWLSPDDLAGRALRSDDVERILKAFLEDGPGLPLSNYVFADDGTLAGFYL